MKKSLIIATLVCLLSVAAHAQYNTISINNSTPCTVYIVLHGTTTATCTGDYRSTVLAIGPGITTFSNPTSVPGGMTKGGSTLGSTGYFTFAKVYQNDPTKGCTLNFFNLTDCSGISSPSGPNHGPWTLQTYNSGTMTCNDCGAPGSYQLYWNVTSPTSAEVFII